MTIMYTNNPDIARDPSGVALVYDQEHEALDVYVNGHFLESVSIAGSAIIRPDCDAMYISKNGRVWKPQ